jgi:hypothetical protein
MKDNWLRCGVLLAALMSPAASHAANGIGGFTGTSTPEVVTPQMSAPPQTPAYPQPPIGTNQGLVGSPVAPPPSRSRMRVVAPPNPHG